MKRDKKLEESIKKVQDAKREIEQMNSEERKLLKEKARSIGRRWEAESIDPPLGEFVSELKADFHRKAKYEKEDSLPPGSLVKLIQIEPNELQPEYEKTVKDQEVIRNEMQTFFRKLEKEYGYPEGTFKIERRKE